MTMKTVLLIHPQIGIANRMAAELVGQCQVVCVTTLKEAEQIIEVDPPDGIIVTDCLEREGDGLEFARKLHEGTKYTGKIVGLVGNVGAFSAFKALSIEGSSHELGSVSKLVAGLNGSQALPNAATASG